MELVRGLYNLHARQRGSVVTIGNYDGIHLGHQEMLRVVRERAAQLGTASAVLSFEPIPREYFARDGAARLTRFREKFETLTAFGIDRFICLRFDARMQSISPEGFINDILSTALGVRHVVVGHDFRFACRRAGTIDTLREWSSKLGFGLDVVPPLLLDSERVSSSLLRDALARGDMTKAAHLLGRPYRMSGKVVSGAQLGRKLGFPTANIQLQRRLTPIQGVFAARVSGAGLTNAAAVTNLGTRPVVNGVEPLLEAHIFDFDGDLYGQYLHVDFVERLRDEVNFPNLDALVVQMNEDARRARRALSEVNGEQ
jgi:riboflavin kinase / FMN adenylyltransferase